ncbi:MAG TPA: RDD family protein [Clostridia bacterium]
MKKTLEILTPENVHLEYEAAGLGSRHAAALIDSGLQIISIFFVLVCISILSSSSVTDIFKNTNHINLFFVAICIILTFIIFFGYFIIFEMALNGQTPGKKLLKLRVIKENGEPLGIWESLTRNILRIIDYIPLLNFIDIFILIFSDKYKRIGDYASSTIVIKTKKEKKVVGLEDIMQMYIKNENEMVNLYPVNNFEYGVLKEFMERKDNLSDRKPVFAYNLNKYFMNKFCMKEPLYPSPYEFFEAILRMNSGV